MSDGISAWDLANYSHDPCVRCGAQVKERIHLGGSMEAEIIEKRCTRCRNDQKEAGQ